MRVPLTLKARAASEPADALLVLVPQAADVLRVAGQVFNDSCKEMPTIFVVGDTYLVKLARPSACAISGVLRLRAVAENLFVPVNADLSPPLLADEMKDLVARRGLVMLPDGRMERFDPQLPVALADFVEAGSVRRGAWQALPEGGELADRLSEIMLELPQTSPDDVIETGGEGIAEEEPRPPASNLPARIAGKSAMGLGKGLAQLGQMLGIKSLSRLGAKMMAAGMSLAPRVSEELFGQMEAGLRDLLREFREGNIERALRRAVPLDREGKNQGGVAGNPKLPFHNLLYSLANILPSSGRAGGGWFAAGDTFFALEQEYRKQAQLAAKRGDFRRAAFIYGKLLRDYHSAAAVLAQGGLHRDAAILYEKQLRDPLAAARQYEAAGEIDRALQLYRQQGEHIRAAELLRRIGEEEQAVTEYLRAADKMVEPGAAFYDAGELLLSQAKRPDLALRYYWLGWERGREGGTGTGCAVRMLQIHTQAEEPARGLALVDEAEVFFRQRGNEEQAGEFFNEVVRLADQPVLLPHRDELRDRALLVLAGKLRDGSADPGRANNLVSRLLGMKMVWPTPVVSDARYAVRGRPPIEPAPLTATTVVVRTRTTELTALCQAAETGDIFFGFKNGELARYHIKSGEVSRLRGGGNPVHALACSDHGNVVVMLGGGDTPLLSSLQPENALKPISDLPLNNMLKPIIDSPLNNRQARAVLCPYIVAFREERLQITALWDGQEMSFRQARSLGLQSSFSLDAHEADAVLIFPQICWKLNELGVLVLANGAINHYLRGRSVQRILSWRPRGPGGLLLQARVSTLAKGASGLEICAVDYAGAVHWTDVWFDNGLLSNVSSRSYSAKKFRAAALVRSGMVAAVADDAIVWLSCWEGGIRVYAERKAACLQAVACFAHEGTRELVVITADSTCHRFPQPF